MKHFLLAARLLACALLSCGCTHTQVSRYGLTPAEVAAFNAEADGKAYSVQFKDGNLTRGLSGLSVRKSSRYGWLLVATGSDAAGVTTQTQYFRSVESLRIHMGSRKSSSRGFLDGAGLGLAVGAGLGLIVGAATAPTDPDPWFSPGESALLGGALFGLLGGVLGGVGGAGTQSTIHEENQYNPNGF